jgi:hypothetical protein
MWMRPLHRHSEQVPLLRPYDGEEEQGFAKNLNI